MQRKTIEILLPGVPRPAVVILYRDGQVFPSWGDDVKVTCEILLPANQENPNQVEPCIRLDSCFRITVGGHVVDAHWAERSLDRDGTPYVARRGFFYAQKWSEAFQKAETYILGEINKLTRELKRRRALCDDAD